MTDRELLVQLADHFEYLRRAAVADTKISRNGIVLPKWRVIAEACQDARQQILDQLAQEEPK